MPLTPSQTRELLDRLGHRARKPLGQNFLVDANIVRKSLAMADVQSGDCVVEIGPGLGTLTEALLAAGCTVHAVELDPTLAAHLRTSLLPRFPDSFHLLEGDAVDHPRASLPATCDAFKVVANLPYAITTPWLERLLRDPLPQTLVLMMQREAADRITARHGSKAFGAISVFVNAAYQRSAIHPVARACFYPVPGVDSLLLKLERKAAPFIFPDATRDLVRAIFTQRRKQIGGILAHHQSAAPWLDSLAANGISPQTRPEAIPADLWIHLLKDPVIRTSSDPV
jgi:16S rRNA (adenine1518-N6/adenine1519-N6)-dimethyltransferase